VKVLGGMLVHRSVTAAYVTATEAQPEVYPCITHLQALLTAPAMRTYRSNFVQVLALLHVPLLQRTIEAIEEPPWPSAHDQLSFWRAGLRSLRVEIDDSRDKKSDCRVSPDSSIRNGNALNCYRGDSDVQDPFGAIKVCSAAVAHVNATAKPGPGLITGTAKFVGGSAAAATQVFTHAVPCISHRKTMLRSRLERPIYLYDRLTLYRARFCRAHVPVPDADERPRHCPTETSP
jgi:hypothetical protein